MKTNKRKRRQVLVDLYDGTFSMDKEDHRVVCEILSSPGILGDEKQWVDVVEIDEEQRVSKLNLAWSNITMLPPSIGQLTNVKELDLSGTQLMILPEEIGDLISLNKLDLQRSDITSLPPSIGRLKHLNNLDLSFAENLVNLPEEIGDLIGLDTLDLDFSSITALPRSIGLLKNLNNLKLSSTEELENLPEEIGNLTSLNCLCLRGSSITALPPSIGRLKNLTSLYLDPPLSSSPVAMKLYYGMAHNTIRSRFGLGGTNNGSVPMSSKLWPLVLHNATRAFQPFRYHNILDLKKTDAIYQLLVDGRTSFLGVLVNRETTNHATTQPRQETPKRRL